jgi:hypothetical protein
VQDVTQGSLIPFLVLVELAVAGLHLDFHIFKKAIFPFASIHLLTFLRNKSAQGFQVSILLYLVFCLFLLRNNFLFRGMYIRLLPPLVLFFNLSCYLNVCVVKILLIRMNLLNLVLLNKWFNCIQILATSKSHQQRILMNLRDCLFTELSLWNHYFC